MTRPKRPTLPTSPQVLLEDYAFLREQGQTDKDIAARFGVQVDSLHAALSRARTRGGEQ